MRSPTIGGGSDGTGCPVVAPAIGSDAGVMQLTGRCGSVGANRGSNGHLAADDDGVKTSAAAGEVPDAQAVEPSDVQMSIFVRTREMTSSVKSDVVAEPPRSGVFTPVAVVSSTDS